MRTLVVGMAKSGVAAARLLMDEGVQVALTDQKSKEQLAENLKPLKDYPGAEWRSGDGLFDGISEVVISPGVPIDSEVPTRARALGIPVSGELEVACRYFKGRLAAITGTNGKTTTTTLLGEIMKNAGHTTYVVGNIGDPFADVSFHSQPGDVAVCEVSSFQLESIHDFHPRVSAILNITEDHLNRHHDMATYIAMKERIFENQTGDDALVLNLDDPLLRETAKKARCRVAWFSRKEEVPFGACVKDGKITLMLDGGPVPLCGADELLIPGAHNLENALAAGILAALMGADPAVIRQTLVTFKGVEHRIEPVREVSGVLFINDSKGTNADSVEKAIDALSRPAVLLMGGSEKHVDFAQLCRKIVESGRITAAVLIGETAPQLDRQLREAGFDRITHCGRDFRCAIETAYGLARPGDAVLLSPACASFDMFSCFEERGEIFKDIVMKLPEKEGR